MKADRVLTFVLACFLVLAVGATIYLAVSPKVGERFTEFYILGVEGKAAGYPTNLTVGDVGGTCRLRVIYGINFLCYFYC